MNPRQGNAVLARRGWISSARPEGGAQETRQIQEKG
jgi:hypothetical protein